jgi:hypothetical protein
LSSLLLDLGFGSCRVFFYTPLSSYSGQGIRSQPECSYM